MLHIFRTIDESMNAVIEQYRYNQDIKKYANRHYFNDWVIYSKVKLKKDVDNYKNAVLNKVKLYKEVFPLEREDIEDVEKAIGRYELAVSKVLKTIQSLDNDFDYDAHELKELVENINIFYNELAHLSMRRMCQD
ncbi:hypothetical protein P5663_10170 [Priestia flexa]|uniref:hypothetical protein n=1 Tax=Priestia flexa TaxID=86664 RepID=UPI00240D636E|nr:hypothetical protein [Priestia flexa]WEZ10169.1 hypothetical protein P5663_10170 [Priestia flexa]